jgi:hypothetical protein
MSKRDAEFRPTPLLLAGVLLAAACATDETPTGSSAKMAERSLQAAAAQFGPFPGRTTIFVDPDNATGNEDGSRAHPFNTLSEGLRAAQSGDAVGLAPGIYAEDFDDLTPNYVIRGRRTFKLLGMGPGRTIIRGDHSFSLIRVQNGPSGTISGMTIEGGGDLGHNEGGGLQVLGISDPVSLTVSNVIFQDNAAVNGGAIAVSGRVNLRLVNVLIANNLAGNCCGGVVLEGVNGLVQATFRNVTVTANRASFHTGGVLLEHEVSLDLVNSIVWNNQLAELSVFAGTERFAVSYSDVGEGLLPGTGNISADPRFLDPGSRDYRLRGRSPAVDAGTNVDAPRRDIRGLARPLDGNGDGVAVTDMGAYEFGKIFSPTP